MAFAFNDLNNMLDLIKKRLKLSHLEVGMALHDPDCVKTILIF